MPRFDTIRSNVAPANGSADVRRYLYHLFNTREVRHQIAASASGTKVRHTSPGRIRDVIVEIPSACAQRRIARALGAYGDLIENNVRRMTLLEQAARLLYEEWFIRLRFPGHEHTPMADGLPDGWERRRLKAVAEVNRELLGRRHDGVIHYVDIASVTPGQINDVTVYVFRDAPGRARRVVRHGDVIWSCVRPNRRSCAMIWRPPDNLIVSTGFAVLSPTLIPTSYLYAVTTTPQFIGYLENRARGVAYPAVTARDFEEAEISLPPQPLLRCFNEFVEPMIAQIHVLWQQNRRLREARDLLLPRLMSGQIAV